MSMPTVWVKREKSEPRIRVIRAIREQQQLSSEPLIDLSQIPTDFTDMSLARLKPNRTRSSRLHIRVIRAIREQKEQLRL